MRNKTTIIAIVIAIILVIGSFFGGWYLNQYYSDKDNDVALGKASSFSISLSESDFDTIYNELPEGTKLNKTADDFKNEFKEIKEQSLQPGVAQIYESGSNYLVNQDFVDNNGEPKKLLILSVDKIDGDFVITSYALN